MFNIYVISVINKQFLFKITKLSNKLLKFLLNISINM